MAFFGITSLGLQNSFQHSLINALAFNLYSEEEFAATFKKIDKDGSGFIEVGEVEQLLRQTYGFEPLPEQIDYFMKEFDANRDGRVSFEQFQTALVRIKESLDEKAKKTKQLSSYEKYREMRFKHKQGVLKWLNFDRRAEFEPTDKYKTPVTSTHSHGFKLKDPNQLAYTEQPKHPKNSCHETRYAEEMIRTGFNF